VKALRTFGPVVLMLIAVPAFFVIVAANYHRPHFDPPVAAGAIGRPVSLRPDLARVLADLRKADREHREAWIADGYSSDLQVLADDAGSGDATQLATDAQNYLDAAYAGADGDTATAPPPGWQQPYAQLRADLNALAAQYGLAPDPAPDWAISGTAVPLHPWSSPAGGAAAGAGACTADGGTVSSSTSSTGAHSQSVSVKTKCPSGTTTVTHKTSVSAAGAVTNTTTTTTAPPSTSSSSGGSG
jgi:hypothetical protein